MHFIISRLQFLYDLDVSNFNTYKSTYRVRLCAHFPHSDIRKNCKLSTNTERKNYRPKPNCKTQLGREELCVLIKKFRTHWWICLRVSKCGHICVFVCVFEWRLRCYCYSFFLSTFQIKWKNISEQNDDTSCHTCIYVYVEVVQTSVWHWSRI